MKFSEFNKQPEQEARKGQPVGGTFLCQTCNEDVGEGEYFGPEQLLRWKCSEGHISYIENFSL